MPLSVSVGQQVVSDERGIRMLDTSRQWTMDITGVHQGHRLRYEFAKKYATGRTLDAACGCGYGSSMLMEVASTVYGVDCDAESIRWARKYFPGPNYILGRMETSPWQGRFDTVVSLETIEHLQEPEPVLKALRKACRGKFIVSTPNEDRYPFVAEAFKNDASPHYRHYTPLGLQQILEAAGFKVLSKHFQHGKISEVCDGIDGVFILYVCE